MTIGEEILKVIEGNFVILRYGGGTPSKMDRDLLTSGIDLFVAKRVPELMSQYMPKIHPVDESKRAAESNPEEIPTADGARKLTYGAVTDKKSKAYACAQRSAHAIAAVIKKSALEGVNTAQYHVGRLEPYELDALQLYWQSRGFKFEHSDCLVWISWPLTGE